MVVRGGGVDVDVYRPLHLGIAWALLRNQVASDFRSVAGGVKLDKHCVANQIF